MDTGLPGKYSYYGDTDKQKRTTKEAPSVLEHHQGHARSAPSREPRRPWTEKLYKFGCLISICLVFILVIVLSSILSSDSSSGSGGTEGSIDHRFRRFKCHFFCNKYEVNQRADDEDSQKSITEEYKELLIEAFKNTSLQPFLDQVDPVEVTEKNDIFEVNTILQFINSTSAIDLNADFIRQILQESVPKIDKDNVEVEELLEVVTTERPPENISTLLPPTTEVPLPPPPVKGELYDVLPFCRNHGWEKTCYPNLLGYRTPEEALASLSFFQLISAKDCHDYVQFFSCALLQPPCNVDTERLPMCKPFCQDVKEACHETFMATEIGKKDLCSDENTSYGPLCTQTCASSDFTCEHSKLCINKKRRCDSKLDCGPGDISDELNCTCRPDQFRCNNGRCLEQKERCNNVNDCGEWEDEKGCQCREGWKQCAITHQCFPSSSWCDRKFDCADRTDETECVCQKSEFRCQNGLCRPLEDRCNGINDCGDFSDELDCVCQEDQFLCDNHLCKYYVNDWCNGKADCLDGTDEPKGCGQRTCECLPIAYGTIAECKLGQFKCDDGTCIPQHHACDQRIDCNDGSDERHCKCKPSEFECEPGHCIPIEQVCDGEQQCANRKDELQNCDCPISTHFRCNDGQCLPLTLYCNYDADCANGEDEGDGCPKSCPAGYAMKCIHKSTTDYKCLPETKVCDGIPDCDQNEDEKNCGPCKPDQFTCNDGTCIPMAMYCTGVHHCPDLSDEKNCTCHPEKQNFCDNGWCYLKEHRCDGRGQCADLSDEAGCSCRDVLAKMNPKKICDRVFDCPDKSDEQQCEKPTREAQTEHEFLCHGGKPINVRRVCDGHPDCPLGDDELHCVTLVHKASEDLPKYWEYRSTGVIFLRRQGNWAPLCAELNNTDLQRAAAFHACEAANYAKVQVGGLIVWNATESTFYPPDSFNTTDMFQSTISHCPSGMVLYVSCSQTTCGNNPYKLGENLPSGVSTHVNTMPYHAAIYSNGQYRCDGVIVDDQWVLTTATCLDRTDVGKLTVRAGVQRNSSLSPYDQISPVPLHVQHSMYNGRAGSSHDLAVLRLAVPLIWTPFVQPICIDLERKWTNESSVHTVGMGRLYRTHTVVDFAQFGRLAISNASTCRLNPITRLDKIAVHDDQWCAFKQPDDYRCEATYGSPVMTTNSDGRWCLIALTGRPHSCTSDRYPSLYIDVPSHVDWIWHAADIINAHSNFQQRLKERCLSKFACLLGNCIPQDSVCDGVRDCAFGEDEICKGRQAPISV